VHRKIFISIEDNCNTETCNEANIIIATFETDGPGEVFLLISEVLESINHSTIYKIFDRSMFLLLPDGIQQNVLLSVTDAAPYSLKAGKSIKLFYKKSVHDTCLAYALHRVATQVRSEFPQVGVLMSRTKIFIKTLAHKMILAPGVPLSSNPVTTRQEMWTDTTIYYCDHFQVVKYITDSIKIEDVGTNGNC
jgi:hypothetical protein